MYTTTKCVAYITINSINIRGKYLLNKKIFIDATLHKSLSIYIDIYLIKQKQPTITIKYDDFTQRQYRFSHTNVQIK